MKIFIIGSVDPLGNDIEQFSAFGNELGRSFSSHRVTLILCSPYHGSLDFAIVEGIKNVSASFVSLELHYPNTNENTKVWQKLLLGLDDKIRVQHFVHEAPRSEDKLAMTYAWLYCQLQAVAGAHRMLVVGGKIEGSSDLLTRIAEAQLKEIIPLARFGGVGERFFDRKKYELHDKWGPELVELFKDCSNPNLITAQVANELSAVADNEPENKHTPVFFISYARQSPGEADYIEMLLRRREYTVLRDDEAIAAGAEVTPAIKEMIYRSTVFIAVWSKDYACSPWCYDELELGLATHQKNGKAIWIFRTDETRIIHPGARGLNFVDTFSRAEVEGKLLKLLEKT